MTGLSDLLFESCSRHPARAALIVEGRTITYADLAAAVTDASGSLRALGVERGQRVAVLMTNGSSFVEAYFSALAVGACVVPLNPLLVRGELENLVRDSGSSILLTAGDLVSTAADVAAVAGCRLAVWSDLPAPTAPADPAAVRGDDDAVIIYTSGTTGTPKGAVLTHSNLLWNAWISASTTLFGLTEQDVILAALPFFHVYGMTCVMNAGLLSGSSLVVMPRFDSELALQLMKRHHVTVFEGVPTMYVALLEAAQQEGAKVPALRLCTSGGAPLALSLLTEFESKFGTFVLEGYGLSETSPMTCFNQPHFPRRPGSVGRPVWGVDVEIAREDVPQRVERLPAGERGEIVVRGHNVFKGYLNRPEATAASVVDGWFRTGDIGIKDDDGYVTIVDRKKDLIIRGGYNVYPREIEEVLKAHPAVADAAVVGRPDARHGEEVVAVVRLESGSVEKADTILRWVSERVGRYKRPRELMVVDHFPLSATGKILKRELARDLFATGASSADADRPHELLDAISTTGTSACR